MYKVWCKRIGHAFVLMLAVIMLTGTKAYATDYVEYTSIEDAAEYVRSQMVARNETIVVGISEELYEQYAFTIKDDIVKKALEYTEDCAGQEGDALVFGCSGYKADLIYKSHITYSEIKITVNVSYYTTAEQEKALTSSVDSAMKSLSLDGKTDYEKVEAIHNYICNRVDYDNINDDTYSLKHSAYAAMVNKKAVSRGYAVLFYRMCKEAGLSVRIISGTGNGSEHVWNIVKVGNYYYNVDCTWDGKDSVTLNNYFLKSEKDFTDHVRDEEYNNEEFHNQYVMSFESYGTRVIVPGKGILTLSDTNVYLETGETHALLVYIRDERYNADLFTWTSSDNKVATVDATGRITATGAGKATITCEASYGRKVSVEVKVYGKMTVSSDCFFMITGESQTITIYEDGVKSDISNFTFHNSKPEISKVDSNGKITAIGSGDHTILLRPKDASGREIHIYVHVYPKVTLDTSKVTVKRGESYDVKVYEDGVEDYGAGYRWSSSNTDVASVGNAGTIYGKKPGTATITCEATRGRKLTVTVTVQANLSLTLNEVPALEHGETYKLNIYEDNVKALETNYIWASSNTKVATVDSYGKITAVGTGTATITCKAKDGRTLTKSVTVKPLLTLSVSNIKMKVGEKYTFKVYEDGIEHSASDYEWESTSSYYAQVEDTGVVTARKGGTSTIRCKSSDGRIAQATVTVEPKTISISASKLTVEVGDTTGFLVYIDGLAGDKRNYTWTSSNTKVATVDEAGIITAVGVGTATITVKIEDGRTKSAEVTVTAKTNGLVNVDGKFIWFTDGVKDTSKTGLVLFDGEWFYIIKGELSDYNGFVEYDGEIFYIAAGRMVQEANGLVEYNGEWYFVADGRVVSEYTGLAEYNGAWFYVANGKMDTTKSGMVEYDGGLFYVGAGKYMKHVSGLAQDPVTGKWYFLAEGQVQKQHTGLALYDGKWFYVINGEFANTYTGYVTYDGSEFYVKKGEVQL